MANFMQEPAEPVKLVWVVNPVGRVVEVPETFPEVVLATVGDKGWKKATPDQIKEAKEAAKAKVEAEMARQHAVKEAAYHATAMFGAAKQVKKDAEKRGPGRPRKNPESETE